MKVVVLEAPGRVRTEERSIPKPREGQALVRVLRGGVCGTDLALYRGSNPFVVYPIVPGHELYGEVVEVRGDGLFSPGDRVVVDPVRSCGACRPCRLGRPNCCEDIQASWNWPDLWVRIWPWMLEGMWKGRSPRSCSIYLRAPQKVSKRRTFWGYILG
ncbi:MAG TPA: hypothetical protein EYP17_04960 [Candidatus Latescibacteria bacterium]|nr:hypothetical protein [Candidatus Latescibacterota bacterium]